MNSAATNYRYRPLNPFYSNGWQSDAAAAKDADEIIACPEKHLLTQEELFKAEGGVVGLGLQAAVVLLGVGSVFATSARIRTGWTAGNLNRYEWACLGGTVLTSHWISHQAGISFFGSRA